MKKPPNNKNGMTNGGPIDDATWTLGDIAEMKYAAIRDYFNFCLFVAHTMMHSDIIIKKRTTWKF